MASDQNMAGVPRPVEELSPEGQVEQADGPSDQGSGGLIRRGLRARRTPTFERPASGTRGNASRVKA
jgi:hypothetical protein